MKIKLSVAAGLLIAAGLTSAAPAWADSQVVGVWVGQTSGQGGMVHGVDEYKPDGTYVSVMQLPNGSIQRIWGAYTSEQSSPNHVRMHLRTQGFLPRQICAQAPGFAVKCEANHVPPTTDIALAFTSRTSFQVNGVTVTRATSSPLLSAAVPDKLILAANAPVQPQMRQPVMPTVHPYVTPGGPGSVQAMQQDDKLQQYRVCAVNGGQVVKEQGGGVRCIP